MPSTVLMQLIRSYTFLKQKSSDRFLQTQPLKWLLILFTDACPASMAIGVTGSRKSTTIEVISKIISAKSELQATGQVIQLLLRQTNMLG